MSADEIKAKFPGYAGWNDRAAIEADFRATGGAGKNPSQPSQQSQATPGNVSAPIDIVDQARKLREFTVQSNQPAIQQFQSQLTPGNPNSIQDRYDKIIANIKQQGQVATNQQTQATTSNLGARGLLPSSPEGQQALASALLPTQAAFGGVEAQAGYQNVQDINQINQAIAALQAGNPAESIQSGLGLANIQSQLQQAQLQAETQRKIALEPTYVPIPGYGVYDILNKQLLGGYSQTGVSPSGNQVVGVY